MDGDWALGGDEGRPLDGRLDRLGLRFVHVAHQPHGEGFFGTENPGRETDVFYPGEVGHQLGQPAQGANVGSQPDVDLFNGKAGVFGAHANIGARRHVDGQPVRDSVQDGDDGWA